MKKKQKQYIRRSPVLSAQVPTEIKQTFQRISDAHRTPQTYDLTVSKLVEQAIVLGLPRLLKKYPIDESRV